jgi:hypothetical protein
MDVAQSHSTAVQKHGPNGYHVHVRFSIPGIEIDVFDREDELSTACKAVEVLEKNPCEVSLYGQDIATFSFHGIAAADEQTAINHALYLLQQTLPHGSFKDMLARGEYIVDTQPLGL